MRNSHLVLLVAGLAVLAPRWSAAQEPDRQSSGSGPGTAVSAGSGAGATSTSTVTTREQEKPGAKPRAEANVPTNPQDARFVRTLTNVQIELTITDQPGADKPEKKTVTMVVSSGSWGRIRSAGGVRPIPGEAPVVVDLNVDARPLVSVDGPIQLELTLAYYPPGNQSTQPSQAKPTGLNQSLTVVLQSGKPLVISQAADPVSDRKIVVEVKATVLK